MEKNIEYFSKFNYAQDVESNFRIENFLNAQSSLILKGAFDLKEE